MDLKLDSDMDLALGMDSNLESRIDSSIGSNSPALPTHLLAYLQLLDNTMVLLFTYYLITIDLYWVATWKWGTGVHFT